MRAAAHASGSISTSFSIIVITLRVAAGVFCPPADPALATQTMLFHGHGVGSIISPVRRLEQLVCEWENTGLQQSRRGK
jgi:hypothetical protein